MIGFGMITTRITEIYDENIIIRIELLIRTVHQTCILLSFFTNKEKSMFLLLVIK